MCVCVCVCVCQCLGLCLCLVSIQESEAPRTRSRSQQGTKLQLDPSLDLSLQKTVLKRTRRCRNALLFLLPYVCCVAVASISSRSEIVPSLILLGLGNQPNERSIAFSAMFLGIHHPVQWCRDQSASNSPPTLTIFSSPDSEKTSVFIYLFPRLGSLSFSCL